MENTSWLFFSIYHSYLYNKTTYFKAHNIVTGKLVHMKGKTPKEKRSNPVYGITCGTRDCNATYVGETKQSLNARLEQHKKPNIIQAQNSAVCSHILETGHSIGMENTFILDNGEQWHGRGIKKAIWECVETSSLNRNSRLHFHVSHIWDRVLQGVLRQLINNMQTSHRSSIAWRRPKVSVETSCLLNNFKFPVTDFKFGFITRATRRRPSLGLHFSRSIYLSIMSRFGITQKSLGRAIV